MKELIKEAEKLYINIDETQSHLIKARLNKDRIREHLELIGLETIVFDVKQLLKCIIDRKDNIVDLGELIHKICEVPPKNGKVVLINPRPNEKCSSLYVSKDKGLETYYKINYPMYIYLEDLLPKGGEEWNTTK